MSAIDDLIAQIEDKTLRERLKLETNRIFKEKKFGLVFEEHLPELTPLYKAEVRRGNLVAKRGEDLSNLWRVLSISEGQAVCIKQGSSEESQFSVEELVVVANFDEPTFPTLVPMDRVQNGPDDAPWHTLIEADNYHALQLLEYLYTGQVDCIYIDPPYNTGARDWKYNNNYVDSNDSWRHSKWLAMMKRRLFIAKRLLKETGVLIITIDDNELAHLDCLLKDLFRDYDRYIIVIEHNKRGRRGKNIAKTNEFALFLVKSGLEVICEEAVEGVGGETRNLRRTGSGSLRSQRPRKFYPIYIDIAANEVVEIGDSISVDTERFYTIPNHISLKYPDRELTIVWPLDEAGEEKNWHYGTVRSKTELQNGKLSIKEQTYGWQVYYKLREKDSKKYKSVWTGSLLDASTHGTELLEKILGFGQAFEFPKSLYAVKQCLEAVVRLNKDALILDFFAGSGTTLNAVNLLNESDGGQRRCIMVTNNEVSETEAKALRAQGLLPGDDGWEKHGICQSITWPRSKYTILGRRDDGAEIDGEYFIGRFIEKEKPRNFYHIDFVSSGAFTTAARKKRFVRIIEGIPQSMVKPDSAFILSDDEKHFASVLFDDTQVGVAY